VAERFSVSLPDGPIEAVPALEYVAEGQDLHATLILGHGAGAPQQSPWMVQIARRLAARGVTVVTFNFPYAERRKSAPDKTEVLEATWTATIRAVRARQPARNRPRLFIGGKSMGGRIASHVAAAWDTSLGELAGLIFFGYPLHPPGRPDQLRSAHLPRITAPMLFIQGARDSFGTPDELQPILASLPSATLVPIEGGDHSLKVSKVAAKQAAVDAFVLDTAIDWIGGTATRTREKTG
jgi:predicted alpha/beta-hydrolase family hydrolase